MLCVLQGRWIFCGEKDSFKTVQIPVRTRLMVWFFSAIVSFSWSFSLPFAL